MTAVHARRLLVGGFSTKKSSFDWKKLMKTGMMTSFVWMWRNGGRKCRNCWMKKLSCGRQRMRSSVLGRITSGSQWTRPAIPIFHLQMRVMEKALADSLTSDRVVKTCTW